MNHTDVHQAKCDEGAKLSSGCRRRRRHADMRASSQTYEKEKSALFDAHKYDKSFSVMSWEQKNLLVTGIETR